MSNRILSNLVIFALMNPVRSILVRRHRAKGPLLWHAIPLSPVRLVLEDSSKRSFMKVVVVSLQLGSII